MRKALFSGVAVLFLASMVSAQASGAKAAGGGSSADDVRQRWVAAENAKDAEGFAAL